MSSATTAQSDPIYTDIADSFRAARKDRLGKDSINPTDFAAIADAGYLLLGVPMEMGGLWHDLKQTGPVLAETIRALARGDSSVALVAAMHPAVLAYWHAGTGRNPLDTLTHQAQLNFGTVLDGHWWGTLMSEPGSGGDVSKTRTIAATASGAGATHDNADAVSLTGEKHFGSGSGQTSFMVTTARQNDEVDLYVIDMREKSWGGEDGLTLIRPWDGHGMCGTQSHAFRLDNCPAVRADAGQPFNVARPQISNLSAVLFCAVIAGVLDEAFDYALERLANKQDGMRALERVELVAANNEHWQAITLFEAARDKMGTPGGVAHAHQAKYAMALHAENALNRLSKVVGGSSFGRSSPLGQWAQDVKALGFLRPPWALQNDQLFDALFNQRDQH